MLKTESIIFFNISNVSEERVLHRAKIMTVKENLYTAEFEEEGLDLKDEMGLFIYFKMDRQFMRQAARIDSVIESESNTLVEFETIGEPFSAENRQALRISSVGADLKATFGAEENCETVDVSATGFAVYSTKEHAIDSRVEATLYFEGETFKGTVSIMAVVKRKGKIRYGVHCIDDPKTGTSLKNGLGRITMAIQRQQLARLARLE
jgi:hypothetical protein